jgi:protein-tyrosine-phosphatase
MEQLSLYKRAHLIVAAIRLLAYQTGKPPGVNQLSDCLASSSEQIYMVCRKLTEQGIIEMVAGAYGDKLFVMDHLKIEALPDEAPQSGMEEELALFKEKQKNRDQKIQDIKNKENERKKKLFEQIEAQLKHPQGK